MKITLMPLNAKNIQNIKNTIANQNIIENKIYQETRRFAIKIYIHVRF